MCAISVTMTNHVTKFKIDDTKLLIFILNSYLQIEKVESRPAIQIKTRRFHQPRRDVAGRPKYHLSLHISSLEVRALKVLFIANNLLGLGINVFWK